MSATEDGVVHLRAVTKIFRDFWLRPRVTAVDRLTLSIERGEALGLLGPNGSGKSTTIKLMLGLLFPTRGQIAVMGRKPTDVELKGRIGYLPEDSALYRFLDADETLDFYGRLFGLPARERRRRTGMLLEMVGLDGARYRRVAEYSKGMQRRLGLAQALINDPELLILDEPTAGMDPIAALQIKDLIRELRSRGKTIVLCTHLLAEVEDTCSRAAILYGGRLRAEGAVDDLLGVRARQRIEVEALQSETLEKIESLIGAEEGKRVLGVSTPRVRLEELFVEIVRGAERAGEETSGARGGGALAEFLRGEDGAREQPVPGEAASRAPAEEASRRQRSAPERILPEAGAPRDRASELAERPETEPESPPASVPRDDLQRGVDRDFLRSLTVEEEGDDAQVDEA